MWDPRVGRSRSGHVTAGVFRLFQPRRLAGGERRRGRKARIWRIDGSAPPIVLRHRALVSDASFSVDDRTVLTGSDDGTARLWRTEDGALVRGFRAGAPVATAALSTDGSLWPPEVTTGGLGCGERIRTSRSSRSGTERR